MTDTRKPIFDAVKAAGGRFPDAGTVALLDGILTRLGVPEQSPITASKPTIPEDYWPLLAKIESGGNPMAKAGTSSASGLYQFIRSTWIGEGGAWGADMSKPFGGLKPTPDEQTARARTFTHKNAVALLRSGILVNNASLYAAHFAGVGTAIKLIGAGVKARADKIAGPSATAANRSIFEGRTVGEFLAWLHKKTGAWAR